MPDPASQPICTPPASFPLPGLSVSRTDFPRLRPLLEQCAALAPDPATASAPGGGPGSRNIFLSLHVGEEFDPTYCQETEDMCRWLTDRRFTLTADVSPKTIRQFGEPDLVRLARRLGLHRLRVDYGLEDQLPALAEQIPLAVNASTIPRRTAEHLASLAAHGGDIAAIHNFYPRPETGLDRPFFQAQTAMLRSLGLKVWAFIPGDICLRGPVHAGLPTLEEHRGLPPSVCFADLWASGEADGVLVGDPGLSFPELHRMDRLCTQGILELPAILSPDYQALYGQVFTCRPDSPQRLIRVAESREYSCPGGAVPPDPVPQARPRGAITLDNTLYGRYSGELQLIRQDLPPDPRVNVIGHADPRFCPALEAVRRGGRFALVPPSPEPAP